MNSCIPHWAVAQPSIFTCGIPIWWWDAYNYGEEGALLMQQLMVPGAPFQSWKVRLIAWLGGVRWFSLRLMETFEEGRRQAWNTALLSAQWLLPRTRPRWHQGSEQEPAGHDLHWLWCSHERVWLPGNPVGP